MNKKCTCCGFIKPQTKFRYKNGNSKYDRFNQCKDCRHNNFKNTIIKFLEWTLSRTLLLATLSHLNHTFFNFFSVFLGHQQMFSVRRKKMLISSKFSFRQLKHGTLRIIIIFWFLLKVRKREKKLSCSFSSSLLFVRNVSDSCFDGILGQNGAMEFYWRKRKLLNEIVEERF